MSFIVMRPGLTLSTTKHKFGDMKFMSSCVSYHEGTRKRLVRIVACGCGVEKGHEQYQASVYLNSVQFNDYFTYQFCYCQCSL